MLNLNVHQPDVEKNYGMQKLCSFTITFLFIFDINFISRISL